jgi:hypothetical protein
VAAGVEERGMARHCSPAATATSGVGARDGAEREAGGFAWLSAMRRGKQKWPWPQRGEYRGALRRWAAHVGTENRGVFRTHGRRRFRQRWRGHGADGTVGQRPGRAWFRFAEWASRAKSLVALGWLLLRWHRVGFGKLGRTEQFARPI